MDDDDVDADVVGDETQGKKHQGLMRAHSSATSPSRQLRATPLSQRRRHPHHQTLEESRPDSPVRSTSPISSHRSAMHGPELVPIDHGYVLPPNMEQAWFEWLTWPCAQEPFTPECRAYIRSLDIERDTRILADRFAPTISIEAIRVMRIATRWLQMAAKAKCTVAEIGDALCRQPIDEPSRIERLVARAEAKVSSSEAIPLLPPQAIEKDNPFYTKHHMDLLRHLYPLFEEELTHLFEEEIRYILQQRSNAATTHNNHHHPLSNNKKPVDVTMVGDNKTNTHHPNRAIKMSSSSSLGPSPATTPSPAKYHDNDDDDDDDDD